MSVEITPIMTQNSLFQQHKEKWKITGLSKMKSKAVQTPTFFPLPNINVSFCFEVWYQKMENINNYKKASHFKLTFNKVVGSDIPQSLQMQLNIQVHYSGGDLYQQYESPSLVSVHDMCPITCVNVYSDLQEDQEFASKEHWSQMLSDSLVLKVYIVFCNHLGTPEENSLNTSSLNNLRSFVKDYTLFYRSPVLSDITFRIGEKTLPGHKFALAAHAPELLKIFERDFLNSKTNCVVINDCKYKTFCSFLWYLYSGDIEDKSWSSVTELYAIADKYVVPTLKLKCAEIISASYLSADNVCKILKIAYACNDKSLKVTARCFAAGHFQALVSTEEWNALVKRYPLIGYEVIAILKC